MTEFLITTWAGAGCNPPLLSVASALLSRGHGVRVLADPILADDVRAAGAEHVSWTRAPHRADESRDSHFVADWIDDPAEAFARLRDRITVGPAAEFAADVREELRRRPAAAVLSELLIHGPLVAAEAEGVPSIVLNPTINIIPTPGVPPFGFGLMPAADEEEQRQHDRLAAESAEAWNVALPALNRAREQQGLPPLEHVLDQGRSAARMLVMTSSALDFVGPLPPTVKYVGPRLDDPAWSEPWQAPAGDAPLVLVALSSDYQAQEDLLQRIVDALSNLPVRGIVTTGKGVDPGSVRAAGNVQVLRSAPHREVLAEAALTITHCGHGTTVKALAAGVPLLCVPMGRDQHDIAARVVHSGAGIRIDADATPDRLAEGVREILAGDEYRRGAQRIARSIAEETAEDRAVAEIEGVVAEHETNDTAPALA